jgi:putative ABC transport system ATP-binding protein
VSRDVAIALRGVTRSYRSDSGSVEALHAVDAAFPAGAISALVGPSGSGKSTLLRLVAGMDAPDRGTIDAGGVDVAALRGAELRRYRRETATFLAQRAAANLLPDLRLREQLGPGGDTLARTLGLENRLEARASELSGGEQARAALVAGMSRGTPIVLIDEPTAELDREAARRVVQALRAAADEGRTVIVATHDADLVRLASTRVELGGEHEATPASASRAPREATEPVIVANSLTKTYDGTRVVDDASVAVGAGEVGVLLGRSGSGKSTLLMMLGGWVAPDGHRATVPSWGEASYMAQRFGLLPELTVAQNVGLPLRLVGADESAVVRVLERLALLPLADRLPTETSVGQQQRTALARALVGTPRAVLADEPTSHQDAAHADLVWAALSAAADEGAACLVATHDESASARADRIWHIADGRIEP